VKKYPNCATGFKYAENILGGKIPSCWQVRASCERFFRDLKDDRFIFDFEKAERTARLVQQFPHIKGPLANSQLIFEPWELFIYINVFGFHWKRTGFRRFTKVFILCARKNGKTALSSPLGLYMLSLDGEEGPEIYALANKKDQARIVFDSAREQANRSKKFLQATGTETFRHHIENAKKAGVYKPLASDSNSLDGLSPHCAIFDEVHSFRDRNIYGVMETAIGARKQPLLWAISTAGFDTSGICHELQTDLEKVLNRDYDDETQFGMIYTLDKDDDFRDNSVWIKSNPNLGVSLDETYIQSMVDKALRQPANKNNVLTKHFNIWCNASESLFDMIKYDACANKNLNIEDFLGEKCFVGVDLSSKVDMTSIVLVFKRDKKYYFFDHNYLPEAAIESSLNASYLKWVEEGHLIKTEGEMISYERLETDLIAISKRFKIQAVHFDPWAASQFAQNMSKKRVEMVEFRMNVANVSESLKSLDALIREGLIVHNGNQVMRWNFSNVVAKEDHNGNIYFRKTHEKFKIDVCVACVLGIAGWINEESKESVYEERGIIVL
jgi:phage terminase large subunit-like protein